MTHLSELKDLHKQVSEMKEPSLEVDRLICGTLNQCSIGVGTSAESSMICSAACIHYTSSRDAAIELQEKVLPGWKWRKDHFGIYLKDPTESVRFSSGKPHGPEPIALIIVVLAALIAEEAAGDV